MIKAVLDTNVFISALFWKGVPYEVVRKSLTGEFLIIISPEIIEEISERLLNKFKFPLADANDFIEIITINSYIVEPKNKLKVVKEDPNDDKIIECAYEGGADYIVSGDKHLLRLKEYRRIKIITPREFIKII